LDRNNMLITWSKNQMQERDFKMLEREDRRKELEDRILQKGFENLLNIEQGTRNKEW